MTLSAENLSAQELTALANYTLATQYIGIRRTGAAHEIVTISKNDITCWQLFLRFFGLGRLQRTQFHLQNALDHLNKYSSWQTLADLPDQNSEQYKAYLTVCTLANKVLLSKNDDTLFNNVSTGSIDIQFEITHQQIGRLPKQLEIGFEAFKTNPEMKVKHLQPIINKTARNDAKLVNTHHLKIHHIRISDPIVREAINKNIIKITQCNWFEGPVSPFEDPVWPPPTLRATRKEDPLSPPPPYPESDPAPPSIS